MKSYLTLSMYLALIGLIALSVINPGFADDNPASASNAAAPINPIKNAIPYAAKPLPLSDVRLTGGPLKNAQDLDAKYLLELQPDRMLAFLRQRAGLEPKAEGYGGWDGGRGKKLTGHICGHYLSAVSLMYAATGDARYKQRADYIVNELKEIQDKRGDGYLGAITDGKGTDGRLLFEQVAKGDIRSGGFDLNGLWSPWYVEHKIFAGLRDAYRYTGNPQALEVEIKFAAWAEGILSKLNDDQIQRVLNTEFGGMNEVTADLYADTGDKRWLALSDKFEHRSIVEPLAEGKDILAGKHGNTLVPKMIGELMRYVYAGNEIDGKAAMFFWDQVALHHSFATGGHGRNEYFGPPDKLDSIIEGRTCETCNVYNMLKMSRSLFSIRPDIRYADFHERALYNHILGSIDPTDGSTCYMVPVGQGVEREYERNMLGGGFTCCLGTGMESHALHGYGLYYESGDKLWVNVYAPSTAQWKSAGVNLVMDTDFPEGESATLKLSMQLPKQLNLALRRPYWAGDGFSIKVNGEALGDLPPPDSYVEIERLWEDGDTIALTLPKTLRLEPLPDNKRRVALMWGPLVLAGDLGTAQFGGGRRGRGAAAASANQPTVPVFLAVDKPVADWLKPVADKPGEFRTDGVGRSKDVDFVPFYRLHRHTYGVYWDLFTLQEWEQKSNAYAAEQEKQQKLKEATVAFVQPGEMQPETDFNFQGEDSKAVRVQDRAARRGSKWFSFDVPVEQDHPMTLIVTYNSGERKLCTFDILVDGKKVGEQKIGPITPEQDGHFFDIEYKIPAEMLAGKAKATVRFEATDNNEIAAVCALRMIRADAER
ncbi:MAG: beta-L-arabinofuranosidase domain-containing protein [Thermoguttaceae bacterium]